METAALKQRRATFLHYFEYAGWLVVGTVLRFAPRRAVVIAADAAGWLMYSVFRVRRQVIDSQLRLAFGESLSIRRLHAIGLHSWQNTVLTFFEFLQLNPNQGGGWDTFEDKVGIEHILRLLDTTRAIFISAHMGNWEALANVCTQYNFQIAGVAKAMHNPLVNRAIVETRQKRGVEVLMLGGSLKKIIEAARAGKWITFLGDQDARRNGIFVNFFGQPASTAEGPALFAWKLGLPLLPTFCVRVPGKLRKLKLIVLPPIYPDQTRSRDDEIRRLTEQHVAALESVIREYPEDYFWLHRRWKTQPKRKRGQPKLSDRGETEETQVPAN